MSNGNNYEMEELRGRWEQIAAGIEDEMVEEAKLEEGMDGHEAVSGGSEEQVPEEVDELLDGQEGEAGGAESDGSENEIDEVYVETPESEVGAENGQDPTEVEGYDPAITETEGSMEAFEHPEIVHGKDDRVRVWNTKSFPYRTICKLEITAADGSTWRCSGAMIGPRTVLTNGHCVFMHKRGGWVKKIRVIPGKNVNSEPYGSATSTFFHSVKGWTKSKSSNYDYAVVVLPSNKKLGNVVGWMGLASLSFASLLGLRVNNSGYPGDKNNPPNAQWWNANNILAVTSRRVYYRIDTYGGQSGSPVWRYKNKKRHIIAVHNTGGSPFNGGVRLVKPVFDNLVKWKNQYK